MKTILITGGSHGIGLALVNHYLEAGWRVINFDKNSPKKAIKGAYHFVYVDLAKTETLEEAFNMGLSHTKHLDAIIHNAAYQENVSLKNIDESHLDEAYRVNIKAPIMLTKWYVNQFIKSHGRIIFITSTRAYMSEKNTIAYSMSKGALEALKHSFAITLEDKAITVNAIAPGWIHTRDNHLREVDHKFHPSNRVGTPADIARACLYLTDEANGFINGETIVIDGGVTKKMIYPE